MELRDYARILRRRGWIIVLVAILAAVAAFGFSRTQVKVYQATAKLNVEPARPDWGLSNTLKDLMRSYVERIRSYNMAEKVIRQAQLDMSPDTFRSHLNVTTDPSTFSIQIDARDRDPTVAMLMANTMADVFVQDRVDWNKEVDKRDRIDVSVRDYARYASLFKPKPKTNALAGGILGVLCGGLIVILLEWLESATLRTAEETERLLSVPVLGAIPAWPASGARSLWPFPALSRARRAATGGLEAARVMRSSR
jgi:capsular polysaccharide biosynthesis protein